MKAWRFFGTHKPFEKQDIPEPTPGPGEVKLKVKAAGICHSDVGILEDEKWMPLFPNLPITPGHEVAGVIEELGTGVTKYKVGDRVVVWPLAQGVEKVVGYGIDGGWQSTLALSENYLIPVPDGVPWDYAAASTDAGMTSHGAVMGRGALKAGEKIAIIGFGGLGQVGARVAKLNGADVYVAEINEEIWPRAKEVGATKVVKDISELADDGIDVVVDFAGFGETTNKAVEIVNPGGRVVLVGMGKLSTDLNTYPLITGGKSLLGSVGGSREDIEEVLKWMALGEIKPDTEHTDWEGIPDGVERLHQGKVRGRLVALY